MGAIQASFRWAYSIFQIPGGWLGDRIGPRKRSHLIVCWWSLFTSFTALAWNATSMVVIRFIFGMGEAGAFPIATRSLSRWMLAHERGHAQGITHAGSRLGAASNAAAGCLADSFAMGGGCRSSSSALIGLLWAATWFYYYRDSPEEHAGVNDAERELIHSSSGGARAKVGTPVPWRIILSSRTIWALSAMYFCYQYSLAVYLDWFPTYLKEFRGFSLHADGFLCQPADAGGHCGRPAGRLADGHAPAPNRKRYLVAASGGGRRIPPGRRGHHPSDADPRSENLCRF